MGNSIDKKERTSAFKELIYWDGGMEQLYKAVSVMIKGVYGHYEIPGKRTLSSSLRDRSEFGRGKKERI